MDGAFFRRDVIEMLERKSCHFAVKVPLWKWLSLLPKMQMRTKWNRVSDDVEGFVTMLQIPQWNTTLRGAWQWLSITAHNLYRDFQIESGMAAFRGENKKTTYLHSVQSIKTSRFEWLNVAGCLLHLAKGRTLRLAASLGIKKRFREGHEGLSSAA